METIKPMTYINEAEVLPPQIAELKVIQPPFAIPLAFHSQIRDFAGFLLKPYATSGFSIAFDFEGAYVSKRFMTILRSAINHDLIPLATIGDHEALLLITPDNSTFGISLDSGDVSYLGELHEAILSLLNGTVMKSMIPVLPVRDFPQWHNMDIFDPKQAGVYWVISSEWTFEKPATEDERIMFGNHE
jgi:hypothetical protein